MRSTATAATNLKRVRASLYCRRTEFGVLRYTVDLGRAARADRFASIDGEDIVAVSPTLWMWRPRLLSRDEILATFSLAGGGQVFVPWQMMNEEGTDYRLKASPQSGSAIALFGAFQQSVEQVAGADFARCDASTLTTALICRRSCPGFAQPRKV